MTQQNMLICQYFESANLIQVINHNDQFMDINELLFLGVNKYGQAGIGQKYHNQVFLTPKSFAFSIFIKQISCGSHHSALLTIDGNIYTMGSNIHGALGSNPNLNYSFVPTLVQGLSDVTKIDCGPFHMCAISNGQLYSWGKGIDGQLGQGNTKNLLRPTKVEGLGKKVENVSCGTNHTLVLAEDDKNHNSKIGYAFGNGIYGQLGSGLSRNSYHPIKIKLDDIESIAAGQNHSLFISRGNVYSCGDNSTGQLGSSLNKKFISEPIYVELPNKNGIKLIQAKKYSMALTDEGEMYVWGVRTNFGKPKLIQSYQRNHIEVIDIKVGNQQIYGLATEGALYSWNIKNADVQEDVLVCKQQKVVENGRAILDFSIGDSYLLILGDIVKQIPYSSVTPSSLGCYDELEFEQLEQRSIDSSEKTFIQSQFLQQSKNDMMNHKMVEAQFTRDYIKIKDNEGDGKTGRAQDYLRKGLSQIKDFENINRSQNQPHQKFRVSQAKQQTASYTQNPNKQEFMSLKNRAQSEINDTFEMAKTPSSSILCEPANFLKQSTRKQDYQVRQQTINESLQFTANPSIRKKKYSYSFNHQKENMQLPNQLRDPEPKDIDWIIQMLEKSSSLPAKTEQHQQSKNSESQWLSESEVVKSNRLLRIELRDKELKIGQLQQTLSRKEMVIEAQRGVIKMLRSKNGMPSGPKQ